MTNWYGNSLLLLIVHIEPYTSYIVLHIAEYNYIPQIYKMHARFNFFTWQVFKGTQSWDGLESGWHTWADLGLKKGCGRFLNFQMLQFRTKKYFYIFCGKCKTHSAWRVIFHNSLLLNGQCSWPLILIGWTNVQILCRHIWPMANPTLLRFSKTPAASRSTFIIG